MRQGWMIKGMRTTTLQHAWNNFEPGLNSMISRVENRVPMEIFKKSPETARNPPYLIEANLQIVAIRCSDMTVVHFGVAFFAFCQRHNVGRMERLSRPIR